MCPIQLAAKTIVHRHVNNRQSILNRLEDHAIGSNGNLLVLTSPKAPAMDEDHHRQAILCRRILGPDHIQVQTVLGDFRHIGQ